MQTSTVPKLCCGAVPLGGKAASRVEMIATDVAVGRERKLRFSCLILRTSARVPIEQITANSLATIDYDRSSRYTKFHFRFRPRD